MWLLDVLDVFDTYYALWFSIGHPLLPSAAESLTSLSLVNTRFI
jgi:hypothetical protein